MSRVIMSRMMQRSRVLFLFVCLGFLSSNVQAMTSEVKAAETRVLTVGNHVLKILEQNKTHLKNDPAALSALVRKEILPFIDFDAMAKLTLGKYWRTASASQRTRFINAYRDMLVRTYAKKMLEYAGASMRAKYSTQNRRPGYVTVRTLVVPKNSAPVVANYEVRHKTGDWKAYNVEIAGVNLITNFRTNFTREVTAKGLDALISRLEKTAK